MINIPIIPKSREKCPIHGLMKAEDNSPSAGEIPNDIRLRNVQAISGLHEMMHNHSNA